MAIILGLALGLIVVGVVMCWGHKSIGGVLGQIVYWTGVALVAVGLILVLTPVLVWVNAQLRAMLGS